MDSEHGNNCTPKRRRDRATPFDLTHWQATRDSLASHTGGLPSPYREQLLDEATDLLDASKRHQASTRPTGMLTKRGFVRAAYSDYFDLQGRLERVLQILGFVGSSKDVSSSKVRPWNKLTREEQEREAARAFEEVERNLRSSEVGADDEGE
jgi:hypothetical protein